MTEIITISRDEVPVRVDRIAYFTTSSFIHSAEYSTLDKVLVLTFVDDLRPNRPNTDRTYVYQGVPPDEFISLCYEDDYVSGSVGAYYNEEIKGVYKSVPYSSVRFLPRDVEVEYENKNKFKLGDIVVGVGGGYAVVIETNKKGQIKVQWDGYPRNYIGDGSFWLPETDFTKARAQG